MLKRLWAAALVCILLASAPAQAFSATLGPAASYEELAELLRIASDGDTVLLSGEIDAAQHAPLSVPVSVHLTSSEGAVIHGLHLRDASITASNLTFDGSLIVDGTSNIHFRRNVSVRGADGKNALDFTGSGTLIIEPGCSIRGGHSASGIFISHTSGEFYGSLEGSISGGSGTAGGAGVVISPLLSGGAVMITGSIRGGSGLTMGGHALNLYDLGGNALVTVGGNLRGGDGTIGGNGVQLVSASDMAAVGISGQVKGGDGETHGGNALILMNAQDASSFQLSGHFSGGNALGADAVPGTSLQLVGDSTSLRARIDNCILEEGVLMTPTPEPSATPSPEPAGESVPEPEAALTPEPSAVPSPTPDSSATPAPAPTPDAESAPVSGPAEPPEQEPSDEPAPIPAAEPDDAADESSSETIIPELEQPAIPEADET